MNAAAIAPYFQLIIISATTLLAGFMIGWVVASKSKQKAEQRLMDELTGLRTNFDYVREEAYDLRVRVKEAEEQKDRLTHLLDTTSGHDKFLKVRSELETARRGIQALKSMLGKQEKANFLLKEKIYKYQQYRKANSPSLYPIPPHINKLPVLSDGNDDLQLIAGIDDMIDRKLHSLGIISYRQLAECGPAQLISIQQLIGEDQALPLRQWVKAARGLFIEKYNYSENEGGTFESMLPLQRASSR
uniref:NADH dehydrogenase subunit E n=1 Tax=uncultured Thiotrichaceae bacterium TaxID=298394 RepID=A0A6S6UCJ7_9GAMM|nr:MAG: Unknown protein [uncultured Thiotrichaceae bacterium]